MFAVLFPAGDAQLSPEDHPIGAFHPSTHQFFYQAQENASEPSRVCKTYGAV